MNVTSKCVARLTLRKWGVDGFVSREGPSLPPQRRRHAMPRTGLASRGSSVLRSALCSLAAAVLVAAAPPRLHGFFCGQCEHNWNATSLWRNIHPRFNTIFVGFAG